MKAEYGPMDIEVRVATSDGHPGEIYMRIGKEAYLFPTDAAVRLGNALLKTVDEAKALDDREMN